MRCVSALSAKSSGKSSNISFSQHRHEQSSGMFVVVVVVGMVDTVGKVGTVGMVVLVDVIGVDITYVMYVV